MTLHDDYILLRHRTYTALHVCFFYSPLEGSETVYVAEVGAGLLDAGGEGLFALADPDAGVVELLVGLVCALGVADLGLEVAGLGLDKVADAGEVGELGVGVDVHLDDAILDGGLDLLLGRTGATVENEEAERVLR